MAVDTVEHVRTVVATRYVTPLREGGSLPAIVEADDSGLYVVKFRGAGQGVKALVAEVIAAGIGRALGLQVPELVLVEVDPALGRTEPDDEIRELIRASVGLNLGVDYLPGSITFDPIVGPAPSGASASRIVWFDAFVTNVDRTPRNPNLLQWHRGLYLIDHGASLYFHHDWIDVEKKALSPFERVREHVLLPWADALAETNRALPAKLNREVFDQIVGEVPDSWLDSDGPFSSPQGWRRGYREYLETRLHAAPVFSEEAARARTSLV